MRSFVLTTAGGISLVLATLAAACGGGGGALSLEEYFQELDTIQNEADERFVAQEEESGEPAEDASEEELADYAREAVGETVTIQRDAANAAGDLDPPDEVEGPHNDLVDALQELTDAVQTVVDEIPDTLTMADLEGLYARFDTPELNEPFMAFDEACVALQSIADENEIDVDLECGEDEGDGTGVATPAG